MAVVRFALKHVDQSQAKQLDITALHSLRCHAMEIQTGSASGHHLNLVLCIVRLTRYILGLE